MKKLFYLISLVLLFVACNNKEMETLKQENAKLLAETTSKDSTINEFFGTLDQIESNLAVVKSKQGIISQNASQNNEINQDTRQTINDDIQIINDLMEKNRKEIASLKSKLKNSNMKIKKLEEMLARYEKQLQDKDIEIEQLKQQLLNLNFTVENLSASIDTLKRTNQVKEEMISQKTEEINTAYYALGTEKELKENKVITKSGGFIGIGRNQNVQQDFNSDYFKKIDITKVTTINIGSKKAKLLTSHPSSSYKLEGVDKKFDKLTITNPKEFWKVSKYLVIVVD
jgi:predicted nuclease with TOPRIM domain